MATPTLKEALDDLVSVIEEHFLLDLELSFSDMPLWEVRTIGLECQELSGRDLTVEGTAQVSEEDLAKTPELREFYSPLMQKLLQQVPPLRELRVAISALRMYSDTFYDHWPYQLACSRVGFLIDVLEDQELFHATLRDSLGRLSGVQLQPFSLGLIENVRAAARDPAVGEINTEHIPEGLGATENDRDDESTGEVDTVQEAFSDASLTDRERNIIEALGQDRLTADILAKKAGYKNNSSFRQTLSHLVKRRVLLRSMNLPGYTRAEGAQ